MALALPVLATRVTGFVLNSVFLLMKRSSFSGLCGVIGAGALSLGLGGCYSGARAVDDSAIRSLLQDSSVLNTTVLDRDPEIEEVGEYIRALGDSHFVISYADVVTSRSNGELGVGKDGHPDAYAFTFISPSVWKEGVLPQFGKSVAKGDGSFYGNPIFYGQTQELANLRGKNKSLDGMVTKYFSQAHLPLVSSDYAGMLAERDLLGLGIRQGKPEAYSSALDK